MVDYFLYVFSVPNTKLFPCVVEGDGGDSCRKVSFLCETLLFTNSNNVDEILAIDKKFIGVCMHKISGMDEIA